MQRTRPTDWLSLSWTRSTPKCMAWCARPCASGPEEGGPERAAIGAFLHDARRSKPEMSHGQGIKPSVKATAPSGRERGLEMDLFRFQAGRQVN